MISLTPASSLSPRIQSTHILDISKVEDNDQQGQIVIAHERDSQARIPPTYTPPVPIITPSVNQPTLVPSINTTEEITFPHPQELQHPELVTSTPHLEPDDIPNLVQETKVDLPIATEPRYPSRIRRPPKDFKYFHVSSVNRDEELIHLASKKPLHVEPPFSPYTTPHRTNRPNEHIPIIASWKFRATKRVFHMSVKEALESFGPDAQRAIDSELNQMLEKGVWIPVRDTGRCRAIPSSMFLTQKKDANGRITKFKARLVAGGHRQYKDPSISFHSPTMSPSSLLIIAVIAASEGRQVVTADVGGAYLNAPMTDLVYMTLSPLLSKRLISLRPEYQAYLNSDKKITVQLLKALYGCIQSAKLWYLTIKATLIAMGFAANTTDTCVFNRIEPNGQQTTIGVYVDDLFMTSINQSVLLEVVNDLRRKFREVSSNMGTTHNYLGMMIEFDTEKKVKIHMHGYIQRILDINLITSSAKSPTFGNFSFNNNPDSPLLAEADMNLMHTTSAQLLYIATHARPDILYPVSYLTTRVKKFTTSDRLVLTRILQYLHGTIDLTLNLCIPDTSDITLSLYIDSSFHSHANGKSHSGACLSLGTGYISWRSCKQSLTTKSSTEAELVTASDLSSILFHVRNFYLDKGSWSNNRSCIKTTPARSAS